MSIENQKQELEKVKAQLLNKKYESYIKKLADELVKIKQEAQISLNLLIGCWSFVWVLSLIALANFKWQQGISIVGFSFFGNWRLMSNKYLIYTFPIYVFAVWAAGCVPIILFHRYLLEHK